MPQVVIVGDLGSDQTQALLDVVRRRYMPTAIIVGAHTPNRDRLDRLLPWMAAMKERDGRPTAYVCRDFSCQAPTSDPEELDRQLRSV
jgi:uncharacterized protein YyaL (SSP411 family)